MPQNLNLRMPKPPKIPPPTDPNHTLYIHNLNEKINLQGIQSLCIIRFGWISSTSTHISSPFLTTQVAYLRIISEGLTCYHSE